MNQFLTSGTHRSAHARAHTFHVPSNTSKTIFLVGCWRCWSARRSEMAVGLVNKSQTSRSPSWIQPISGRRAVELAEVSVLDAPCIGGDVADSSKDVLFGMVGSRRPIRTVRLSGWTQSWTSGRLAFLSAASCGCCKTTQWTERSCRRVAGRALQMQADGVGRRHSGQTARRWRLGGAMLVWQVGCRGRFKS
jgi:hypothetical protein